MPADRWTGVEDHHRATRTMLQTQVVASRRHKDAARLHSCCGLGHLNGKRRTTLQLKCQALGKCDRQVLDNHDRVGGRGCESPQDAFDCGNATRRSADDDNSLRLVIGGQSRAGFGNSDAGDSREAGADLGVSQFSWLSSGADLGEQFALPDPGSTGASA